VAWKSDKSAAAQPASVQWRFLVSFTFVMAGRRAGKMVLGAPIPSATDGSQKNAESKDQRTELRGDQPAR
jgi:hypothetical protein